MRESNNIGFMREINNNDTKFLQLITHFARGFKALANGVINLNRQQHVFGPNLHVKQSSNTSAPKIAMNYNSRYFSLSQVNGFNGS